MRVNENSSLDASNGVGRFRTRQARGGRLDALPERALLSLLRHPCGEFGI
jgi:hypothetical protein